MFKLRPIGVFLACTLALNATPGVTIQSDLSSTADDGAFVVSDAPVAQSFTPASAYTLTSVVVVLSNQALYITAQPRRGAARMGRSGHANKAPRTDGLPTTPYVVATLYADNSDTPGAVLAVSATQILDTQLSSSGQQFTFTFSYPLAANTRYWIGLSSPNNSVAFWAGSDSATGVDIVTEFYESDGYVFPADAAAYLIGVFGSSAAPSTPAPTSVLLTLLGLAGAAIYLRRRWVPARV